MAALAVFLVTAAWRLFRGLQKEVAAALVAGATTVLVSVLSVVVGRLIQRRQEIDQAIRDQKILIYEKFVDFWFGYMMKSKSGTQPTEAETLVFMQEFTQDLVVWGSDEIVARWSTWRRDAAQGRLDPQEAMYEFEELLLVVRREFGHRNKGFNRGTVLGLFVNDIEDQPKRRR